MAKGLWDDWIAPVIDPKPVRLVPAYGCKPLTPRTTCQDIHPGGLPKKGSRIYLECCGRSGCDHYECMRIRPGDLPPPKVRPIPAAILGGTGKSPKAKAKGKADGKRKAARP